MMDDADRTIVSLLQTDARLSNAAMAEKVGLTTSTVHERVRKLEKRGVIRGYAALVDPGALGKPITAFIRLRVGSASTDYCESKDGVMEFCQQEPDVQECHTVAGDDCYILKVRASSPGSLEKLIERIRCQARVSRTATSIVLSTLKESTRVAPGGK